VARALDQHRVVVGGDDSTSKAISTIKTHTVTSRRSVDFNLTGIWSEALGGVLGGDTALDGETPGGDSVLGEAKLLQGGACGDLDLCRDDIDAGDLLRNGVLDLTVAICQLPCR